MPVSLIPSFLSFCFINGITPGPANLCSLSTAMNEGKQAALRQWRGLFTGFTIVSLGSVLINTFLGTILGEHVRYLAWGGMAYLLWMAWNIIRPVLFPGAVDQHGHDHSVGKASFWTGLFVQLTNIKIIVFCMTALSSFVLPYTKDFLSLLAVGGCSPIYRTNLQSCMVVCWHQTAKIISTIQNSFQPVDGACFGLLCDNPGSLMDRNNFFNAQCVKFLLSIDIIDIVL